MKSIIRFVTLICILCLSIPVTASPKKYIGVEKCKKCHNKKVEKQIYNNWRKSAHAKAYENLFSDAAIKRAQIMDLNSDPWELNECLVCHSTDPFASKSLFRRGFKMEDGVQCETCHGAGSMYAKKRVMQKITKERESGDFTTAKQTGLIVVTGESCGTNCHRSEVTVNGQTFKKPCHSSLRKFKTILKNVVDPFH